MENGVLVTVTWNIKPEAVGLFVDKLKGDFTRVASRPGFRNIRLLRAEAQTTQFILMEEWDSAKDFMDYMVYRQQKGDGQEFIDWSSSEMQVAIYDLNPLATA